MVLVVVVVVVVLVVVVAAAVAVAAVVVALLRRRHTHTQEWRARDAGVAYCALLPRCSFERASHSARRDLTVLVP